MKNFTTCFLSAVVFLSLLSCDPAKAPDTKATASSPASQSEKPFTQDFTYRFSDQSKRFQVLEERENNFSLPSGTHIKVPAHCFVDASGQEISDEVELIFEEFLTPGSIIASQINMKYDSSGKISDFESAGMFRINAYRKDQEVFIAKNKSIEVALATTDTDKNFNAYFSKENGNDWKYLSKSVASKNPEKKNAPAITDPKPAKPLQPAAYSANGKYFDLNLTRASNADLSALLGVVWEYAGTDKRLDPAYSKVNFNRNWDYINILPLEGDKRGIYTIILQSPDTTIKTIARPVYRGAVLDAANEEFAKELGEFNTRMEQMRNQKNQEMAESSFIRVLQVKNLGLYNYDRQYHETDMTPVLANFDFGNDSLKNYPISVFLITGNGMAVIKYPPHDWEKFMYARKDLNKMIAILPNQEICTFSALRFRKEGPVFPDNTPGKFTFKLNHSGIKAKSATDIDKVLSTI